jgi:hypothetical protein
MSPRAVLLALGSVAGVLTGRALDGLGLLPGVHESAQVRAIALSPAWTVAGVLACVLLGLGVERLLRRSRAAGILLLVTGQLLVLAAPELAGRAGHSSSGEAPLLVAVAVQLALSLVTVTTVVAVRRELRWPSPSAGLRWVRVPFSWTPPSSLVAAVLDMGKGRGPPGAGHLSQLHPTTS